MDPVGVFTTVLGHDRVLLGAGAGAANRVMARDGSTIHGVAAFEALYGRGAEGFVAVLDPGRLDHIGELIDRLLTALAADRRSVVHFVVAADQTALARHIGASRTDAHLHGRELSLRTTAPS